MNPRKKYIIMIVLGFGAPFGLVIISLILFAIANILLGTSVEEGNYLVQNIINTVLFIVGVVGVTGFIWGPILGIVGIVKLSGLKDNSQQNQTDQAEKKEIK